MADNGRPGAVAIGTTTLATALAVAGCASLGGGTTSGGKNSAAPAAAAPAPATTGPATGDAGTVAKVDAVCRSYVDQIKAVPAPTAEPLSASGSDLGSMATYLDRVIALQQDEEQAIDKVSPPETDPGLLTGIRRSLETGISARADTRNAATRDSVTLFRILYLKQEAEDAVLAGVARKAGLGSCT